MERLKKWNWTLVLCAVLLALNLWQGKRLSELESAVWNVQNEVMNGVSRVESGLSSVSCDMEHADDVVLDWDYETSVDMKKHCLLAEVSVVLKEWREDTSGELAWTNLRGNGGESSVPLNAKGAGRFAGTLEIPLTDLSGEFQAAVVVQNGGVQRREELGYLGGSAGLLPIQCWSRGYSGPVYSATEGTFAVSECGAELEGGALDLDRVTGQAFRLSVNGKTVAEQTAKQADRLDQYTCAVLSAEVRPGDEVLLTFCCRDGNGLHYEFFLNGWDINESVFGDTAPEWEYPKLTWN